MSLSYFFGAAFGFSSASISSTNFTRSASSSRAFATYSAAAALLPSVAAVSANRGSAGKDGERIAFDMAFEPKVIEYKTDAKPADGFREAQDAVRAVKPKPEKK